MPRAVPDAISRRHVYFALRRLQRVGGTRSGLRPRLFGLNDEDVSDETYHKAGKMDSDLFSTPLVSEQIDLVKVIRGYLLEGTDLARKLNVYGMCLSLGIRKTGKILNWLS